VDFICQFLQLIGFVELFLGSLVATPPRYGVF